MIGQFYLMSIGKNDKNYPLSVNEIEAQIKTNNSQIRNVLKKVLYYAQNYRHIYNFLKSNLDFDTIDQIQKNEIETYSSTDTCLEQTREHIKNMSDLYVFRLGNNRNNKIKRSISPKGECDTLSLETNQTKIHIDIGQNLINVVKTYIEWPTFWNEKLYIHSSAFSASLISSESLDLEFETDLTFQISEYRFKILEYPYASNCLQYVNKTRADCINQCYLNYYMNQMNCVPNYDHLLTIKIGNDYIDPNISFCSSSNRNKTKTMNQFLINHCNNMCQESCEQKYFIIESQKHDTTNVNIDFGLKYYIHAIDAPKMVFFQYLIAIVNSMSLWHGINFRILINLIIESTASLIIKYPCLLQIGYKIKNVYFARIFFVQHLIQLVYCQTILNALNNIKKYQKKAFKVFLTNIISYMTRKLTLDTNKL